MMARELIQTGRENNARAAERRAARAERLRALYIEVLTSAIEATPSRFGYRPTNDPPKLVNADAERMRARLSLEALEDGDEVLKAFLGVVGFSALYEGEAR